MKTHSRRLLSQWGTAVAFLVIVGGLISDGRAASGRTENVPIAAKSRSDGEASSPFLAFHSWTKRHLADSDPASRAEALPEGIALAKQRRRALLEIIKSDPSQALALSVPAAVRKRLPAEVVHELETRVSGMGDYSVLGVMTARSGPAVESVQRFVRIDGRSYRAYVSGRRAGQTTKRHVPLHGVALDGALALADSALRELEPDEAPPSAQPLIDLRTSAEKLEASASPTLAEVGGKLYRFASRAHLQKIETLLEAAESGIGPEPARSAEAVLDPNQPAAPGEATSSDLAASSYSEGRKSVLIIRVDFPDLPGDPQGFGAIHTASSVQDLIDTQVTPFFQESSYGITSLTNTVTSAVYRMSQPSTYYATNGANYELHNEAKAAAAASHAVESFDRVIVLFSFLGYIPGSAIGYGGMAEVGGPTIWVNGEFDFRVVAHELGHSYGVWHGNLWQVNDGNPISATGTRKEYEDDFDTMGANFANDRRTDFNPWFKNRLNWIQDSQVRTVTTSGIYRINRFDHSAATGTLALKIAKDADRNYWIGCRRNFTTNPSMHHGAYIVWGYNYNAGSDLLDMSTPGYDRQDAALAMGASFVDAHLGLTIWPVAEGGEAPHQYLDIQISFGPMAPVITAQPASQMAAAGRTVLFSIGAAGFPQPSYQWQRVAVGPGPIKWRDLVDDTTYGGTTTPTLVVAGISPAMSGDQFRCVVSNRVRPDATSQPATLTITPPPVNDNFASAILLSGMSAQASGANEAATKQAGEPDHAGNGGGRSLWWKWTAPISTTVSLNTVGSDFDTVLAVYTGGNVSALFTVAANDDSGSTLASTVEFNAIGGTTYWIAVDGYNGTFGSILLTLAAEPVRHLVGMSINDGTARFVLNGQPGAVYVIQTSTNLLDWQTLSSATVPLDGAMEIVDPGTTARPHRFYRALPQ